MTSASQCMTCGNPLQPGADRCERCGTAVQPSVDLRQQSSSVSVGTTVCPSCKHQNEPAARFCEECGTQLREIAGGPVGAGAGQPARPQVGQSEDPWATGPGYDRPLRTEEMCPRCQSHRNPSDTVCAHCGLPFGQQANFAGVPPAVARKGNPAGFWIRFLAAIIDGIIVSLIALGITIGFAFASNGQDQFANSYNWIQALTGLIYAPLFLSSRATTPGKSVFNVYVFDEFGNKPSLIRAFVRELSKYISGLILLIGYIMAAFRQDKRALHDLIAGTYPTEGRPEVAEHFQR